MTIFELWMAAQNMNEYHTQKIEAFGLDNAYAKGVAWPPPAVM